ncbi:MAG TPA: WD40 repeat domain-containing protein [Gemmataceae bacterium]|jgi:WD40 repeat protein|nr:WD40 repeat domain-containing protein [Gemmataceae bacterium]
MLSPHFRVGTAALLLLWAIAVAMAQEKQPTNGKAESPRVDLFGDPLPTGALVRLGTTRFRHDGRMLAVAYAADGKTLVTASEDDTVRRWDVATGKELKRFPAPGFAALSMDGTFFLSVDPEEPKLKKKRFVRLWNTVTNQEAGRFEWLGRYGNLDNTNRLHIAFSHDGSTVAVGSYVANVIVLWDVAHAREIRKIEYIGLDSLALSPDGKTLLTGSDNLLWDVASGKKLKAFNPKYDYGHTHAATFSADGKILAMGGSDAHVLLFDVESGRQLHKFKGTGKYFGGAGSGINSLAFTGDGKTLAVGSSDWTVRLWDVAAGKQLHQLIGPTFGNIGDHGSIHSVAFAPDGKTVAAASNVPMLRQWETVSGREVLPPTSGHRDMILSLAISPDGKRVASASADLTIRLWDAATGKELHKLLGHEGSINGLAFSPDGRRLASAGGYKDETLQVWDTTTGQNLRVVKAGYSMVVAYAPDGKTIATGGSDGIRLFDAETGNALRRFAGNSYHIFFSSDERRISDGTRIWDRSTGELTAEFKTAKEVVLSPDWKLAAVAGETGFGSEIYSARVLEVVTDKEIHTLAKEKSWMSSAVFSPDGRTVATAESKGMRLWETATGKESHRLTKGEQGWYYAMQFAPDGRTLASVNSDTTVLIWSVPQSPQPPPAAALAPAELTALWEKLTSEDAAQAYAAIVQLVRAPQSTVPFLKDKATPVTAPSPERLKQLIADLDNNRFAVREKASGELVQLGELAESALRGVLEGKPSPETRERVNAVLVQRQAWTSDRLRRWRVIQVLEGIGTREAQFVLKTLAEGAPASRLTQEAQAALDRLKK